MDAESSPQGSSKTHAGSLIGLAIGSLGVVFGDIGTSPLYTLQEFFGPHGVSPKDPLNVFGIISLVLWALLLVVTFKYVVILMRADNHGEGGIMALLALAPPEHRRVIKGSVGWVTAAVLCGAALLFGDGIITPAISVLSALEGLSVVNDVWQPYVVPLAVAILVALFSVQSRGTGKLGLLFGPIMTLWFVVIAILGAYNAAQEPSIFKAFNPLYAISFLTHHGWHGFALVGFVVLAVTGGEALYADMGHFGREPIRLSWLCLALPALILCYLGQGAVLLRHPEVSAKPFFGLMQYPPLQYPLVILATAATIIASQGLISAVFSLTHQAIRLGYCPRLPVRHTSPEMMGQIYLPSINIFLGLSCLALVLIFRESSRLAAAFGLAVSGTMTLTSLIFYVIVRYRWGWSRARSLAILLLFLSLDVPFLLSTSLKFFEGGYIPVLVGTGVFLVMYTWTKGRSLLGAQHLARQLSIGMIREHCQNPDLKRTHGTGVYLTANRAAGPAIMSLQLKAFQSLPEKIILLTVTSESVPFVRESDRYRISELAENIWSVAIHTGFMEMPKVPPALEALPIETTRKITYYVGRETFMATNQGLMPGWQESIFAFLMHNCMDISFYFGLPADCVVELGTRVEL